ncbi:MAG: hypothetical protein K9G58_15750 [Bacteroidales bacterium]|nr:hypothetical protein [Bacteroidales bacterium]MCF8388943.1 hypothetical protein [Bacteroidales bacterium]MCF8399623.1 hypothetical protein [Bacteroidales bacterium]
MKFTSTILICLLALSTGMKAQFRWLNPKPTANKIISVEFLNKDYGWIHTSHRIWSTSDGGDNWVEQYTSNTCIVDVCVLDSNRLWFSLHAGSLLYTDDAGASWYLCGHLDLAISDMHVIGTDHIWLSGFMGGENCLYFSKDGGNTWRGSESCDHFFKGIYFTDKSSGWVAAKDGLMRTGNGGWSW